MAVISIVVITYTHLQSLIHIYNAPKHYTVNKYAQLD